ncbi:peptide deformylase [Oxalicibacterium faecigallinarum]|uniref:Peptide deformylase n=1 Tax=Oxalicibacterium faecigallinarum TaxID=573741 RepID=A0A8J3ALE6_9BURK|nr:peptide deformylase [Oxalicibacterium faecigallinarum]GGI16573.1 peptide deformylase [Oxalicibacterium faecigallinarum]
MTVREILKMGDPRLLRVAEPVTHFDTPELHALIADMFDTMYAANGAGLAAPQIGVNLRVVIYGFKQNVRYPDAPPVPETVLINPRLQPLSAARDEAWEGCLSVPGMRGVVPRFSALHYEGFDQYGKTISRDADGFHARVVQHECDHLDGILYPMRIEDYSKFGFTEVLFPELDPDDDD